MDITEEMYLLAKKITNDYEQQLNKKDNLSKNYTFSDMKNCFSAGINRGCFIASALSGQPITVFDDWETFINKYK